MEDVQEEKSNGRAQRRRPASAKAAEASAAAKEETTANAGEAEAPKKRRGRKPGSRNKKATVLQTNVLNTSPVFPEPATLPIEYLVRCATYLQDQIKKLNGDN